MEGRTTNNAPIIMIQDSEIQEIYDNPKPLEHMELPGVIMENRGSHPEGFLSPNRSEILILLRAYRTLQYGKFMRHLLHSYIEHQDETYVVGGEGEAKCCLCGKPLKNHTDWEKECKAHPNFGEQYRREYLTFGTTQSGLCMCIDCLIQLQGLDSLLREIEGPTYLTWGEKLQS